MRVPFWDVFSQNRDGSITPRKMVSIGGVTMGPGVAFGAGVSFSGVDLAGIAGRDLEVQEVGGVTHIKGTYPAV